MLRGLLKMTGEKRTRAYGSERGAILAEFSMVVPVILFLGLCSIEFSRILAVDQYAATISRELAQTAVRQCMNRIVARTEGNAARDCFQNGLPNKPNRVAEIFAFAESLSPGSELILSVYINRSTPASGVSYYTRLLRLQTRIQNGTVVLADAESAGGNTASAFRYPSKFSLSPSDSLEYLPGRLAYVLSDSVPVDRRLASSQQIILVAEAYMKYQPLIRMIRVLLGDQDARYDAAIF